MRPAPFSAPCTYPRLSSRKSQALATLQWRFTVAGEMERKSAVASIERPAEETQLDDTPLLRVEPRQTLERLV